MDSLPAREQKAARWTEDAKLLDGCGKVTNAKIWATVLATFNGIADIEEMMNEAVGVSAGAMVLSRRRAACSGAWGAGPTT